MSNEDEFARIMQGADYSADEADHIRKLEELLKHDAPPHIFITREKRRGRWHYFAIGPEPEKIRFNATTVEGIVTRLKQRYPGYLIGFAWQHA